METKARQDDDLGWSFIRDTFLSNAVRDSIVSRGGRSVYRKNKTEDQAAILRSILRNQLNTIAVNYESVVDEQQHINNIEELIRCLSVNCREFLNEGRATFGFAQKALNSYLKYLWCVSRIPRPPHCPFDTIILGLVNPPADCERRWTYGEKDDYIKWVTAAKLKANGEALSDWELREWGQRVN